MNARSFAGVAMARTKKPAVDERAANADQQACCECVFKK